MIRLHLKIFKLTVNLEIDCKCEKHKESADKHEELESEGGNIETYLLDDSEDEYVKNEYIESEIEAQARKFSEELSLYDIKNADDLPPRHQISDDVEIITDRFEKEVEDIIEGRR